MTIFNSYVNLPEDKHGENVENGDLHIVNS